MKNKWSEKKCVPCEGGTPALPKETVRRYLVELKDWRLSDDAKSIRAEYWMKDFMSAIRLINQVAEIAQKEDHHPDIHLVSYRKLAIELETHAIGGLSENDFILASKIDELPKELKA